MDTKTIQIKKCFRVILKDTRIGTTDEISQNCSGRRKIIKTNKIFSEFNRKIQKPLKQLIPQNYFRRHKIIDANIMCHKLK